VLLGDEARDLGRGEQRVDGRPALGAEDHGSVVAAVGGGCRARRPA
jgi:hypothetical protein